jgi:hypothetical protein
MLRYGVEKNGLQPPTRLNITFVVSLPFLLLLFEVIRYSKIRVSAFAPPGGYVADSRWSRVERGPG